MEASERGGTRRGDELFLPDFCGPRAVLAVVLVAELVAVMLALARYEPGTAFWDSLARISLFLQWTTLLSAAGLCLARPALDGQSPPRAAAAALGLVLVAVAAVSAGAWWWGRLWEGLPAVLAAPTTGGLAGFMARNLLIGAIVTGLLLRYFWVMAKWRENVQAEARARIHALQARMRPHFLFNSMNTIAALTRTKPEWAEEAVEDLADLFRASLSDATTSVTLKEELELSRIYQRIEQHRLGERLQVRWHIAELPLRARIPALSVQPLIENAIYHGIEPLPGGGTVIVRGRHDPATGQIEIQVENPLAESQVQAHRDGNRIAIENLRQRFELAWGPRASVRAESAPDRYVVTLSFPAVENAP